MKRNIGQALKPLPVVAQVSTSDRRMGITLTTSDGNRCWIKVESSRYTQEKYKLVRSSNLPFHSNLDRFIRFYPDLELAQDALEYVIERMGYEKHYRCKDIFLL